MAIVHPMPTASQDNPDRSILGVHASFLASVLVVVIAAPILASSRATIGFPLPPAFSFNSVTPVAVGSEDEDSSTDAAPIDEALGAESSATTSPVRASTSLPDDDRPTLFGRLFSAVGDGAVYVVQLLEFEKSLPGTSQPTQVVHIENVEGEDDDTAETLVLAEAP